jgi:hypothetical protein
MVTFKYIDSIAFEPKLNIGHVELISQSSIAQTIAKSLVGKLQMYDLCNIYDIKFNNREAIIKNIVHLKDLLNDRGNLIKNMLAFATTLNFLPLSSGYNFNLRNNHTLQSVEKISLDYHNKPEILMPLHNLFRLLDGKEIEYIDENSQTSFLELNEVNSLFPYFQLTKAEDNPYHYYIGFTNLNLLKNINEMLHHPSTHLGYTMYVFLNQGKESESFPSKYFNKQIPKLRLVA